VQINASPPSGSTNDVYYFDDDVTVTNFWVDTNKRGVIVCEGDVNINNVLQVNEGGEYQIIATGDITFDSNLTLNIFANDTMFLYTNGTHMHGGTQRAGNVSYKLGWFRDLHGQITCKGSIVTPIGGFLRDARITYQSPNVPGEAWPIPFRVESFRER